MRRRILSQNFLHSRKLVSKLIRQSSIGPHDTVLEIGPGKGIITEYLLQISNRVIAVELDTRLYELLQARFMHEKKFILVNQDILQYRLPTYSYKVFANIPFSIEGKIIRKLLNAPHPPHDCYLVMREDLALRLMGYRKECQFSVFYKPWFRLEITHQFNRTDFTPYARMDSVLFRVSKRIYPLLEYSKRKSFMIFVGQGFGGGKNLKYNMRVFFTHEQFRRLAIDQKFDVRCSPSDLSVDQWIGMYKYAAHTMKVM